MGFKYIIRKGYDGGKLPNGILKSNHLLFGELFKQKKTCAN